MRFRNVAGFSREYLVENAAKRAVIRNIGPRTLRA
jgi:hypothetical protein